MRRTRFLTRPYAAYEAEAAPEDADLTHAGPGTPGGEYLRRFWQPVAYSREVGDLPRRITIMAEDLVLFRDGGGRVGLLQLHCSHRGTSLEFGLVSERGIRCCYHGWLFDVDGRILQTPGEPAGSTLKDRLCHGAYPVHEYRGLVFAYMGPPDRRPAFPVYDMFVHPEYRMVPGLAQVVPCNWLQIKDNSMDPVHTAFLHTRVSATQFTAAYGVVPLVEWRETPIGTIYIASRRVGEFVWVRVNDFILPNLHQFPLNLQEARTEQLGRRAYSTHWAVPVDDTHTLAIDVRYLHESVDEETERAVWEMSTFGQRDDRPYEERQRIPGDWDAQVGQRPVAIHAMEHLGATDRGVIMLRRALRRGIQAVQRGEDPQGLVREDGRIIPTYAQDTVLHLPPAPTAEDDRRLLLETGRKVADGAYAPAVRS